MSLIARGIIVVIVAAALAWHVVRTAAVTDDERQATIGARLWPSHPVVAIDRAMAEIGAQAARGQSLTPATLGQVEDIARKSPLATEPFLIKGALAELEQQPQRAERLFAAARLRDPRSRAARYFLADRYLRTNRIPQALAEIAVMSRLSPEARAGFGPALAEFAKTRGAVPVLRRFFHSSPELEPPVLSHLAEDARNADLIVALWGRGDAPDARPEWQSKLITKLIEQGQFGKAHSVWRLVAGAKADGRGIFNARFEKLAAPPPFNWTFASTGGVVEPAPGGRLQVIYYGRNDSVLAEQLLLLAPGRYQLAMDIAGPLRAGSEIAWTLTCLPATEAMFRLPVDRKGRLVGAFSVPQGCAAQRLQLTALPGEFPQTEEFTIGNLSLTKAAGS